MHCGPMEPWACFLFYCTTVSSIYKVIAQCGGSDMQINASEIYKPYTLKYPESGTYGENLICSWILQSITHNQLLYISLTSLANGDLFEVYKGASTSGTSLYSSSTTGESGLSFNVLVPSNNSYLRFTSNGIVGTNQAGFTVRYMSAVSDDKGGCSTTATVVATDTTQYLTSPNFPQLYPPDISCSWNIETDDSCGSLALDFILLDIERGCYVDKVTVTYDGNPAVELCPSNDWDSASDIITNGNTAGITLSTDNSDQYRGFVMAYTRTGCVTTLTESTASTLGLIRTTSTTANTLLHSTSITSETTTTTTTTATTATQTTSTLIYRQDSTTLSLTGVALVATAGVVVVIVAFGGVFIYRMKKKTGVVTCSSNNTNVS